MSGYFFSLFEKGNAYHTVKNSRCGQRNLQSDSSNHLLQNKIIENYRKTEMNRALKTFDQKFGFINREKHLLIDFQVGSGESTCFPLL